MVAVTGGSCCPSRGGKSTGSMNDPRVGFEKGDEVYLKGRIIRLERLNYAERDMWIKSMDRVHHPWNMPSHPWTGGELHESRATDSTSKSELWVCFLFVCQMKIHIISVLNFRISYLTPPSSFPHPWIGPIILVDFSFWDKSQDQEVYNSPWVFILPLSIVSCPFFSCFSPIPLVDFLPRDG